MHFQKSTWCLNQLSLKLQYTAEQRATSHKYHLLPISTCFLQRYFFINFLLIVYVSCLGVNTSSLAPHTVEIRGAGGRRVHRNHCGWTVAIWKRKGGMSTAPVIRSSIYFQMWNSTKVINCPSFSTLFEGCSKQIYKEILPYSQLIWPKSSFCFHILKTNHVIMKNNLQTPIQVSRVTVYAGQLKFCSSYMPTYVMKIYQRVWIHFLRSVVIWGYHFHLAATPLGAKTPLTTWNSGA